MASKITIQCPVCTAKLNLSDSSKVGKKIKCPKCQEAFTVPPVDDDEFDEDEEPKSSPGRKRPGAGSKGSSKGKKSGKGGSSSDGSNAPLIIGGIVGVVVLVGAGLFFSGIFNKKPEPVAAAPAAPPVMPVSAPPAPTLTPAEKVLGLRWMPADTGVILHLKIADLWQASLLKEPLSNPLLAGNVQSFEQQIGLAPADIEGVTIGIPDALEAMLKLKQSNDTDGGKIIPKVSGNPVFDFLLARGYARYMVIVHTKKPVDLNLIAAKIPNTKLEKSGDKSFLNLEASVPLVASGAYLPSPNLLIIASSNVLKTAMDRGENAASRKEFSLVEPSPQIILMSLVRSYMNEAKDLDALRIEMPGLVAAATKANETYGLKMAALGLSFKSGFDLRFDSQMEPGEGRKKFMADTKTAVDELAAALNTVRAKLPPLFADLWQIALTNFKTDEGTHGVQLTTGIPESERPKLDQLPMVLTMMSMTGGLNGFGGVTPTMAPPVNSSLGQTVPDKSPQAFSFGKQPGETPAVEAVKVEGLPDGVKLSAKTAWSQFPSKMTEGNAEYAIEILLDAEGNGLETICGAAAISPKTMTVEGGSLKKAKLMTDGELQKGFTPFDVKEELAFDHPPRTLRVRVAVDNPAATVTKIDALEGTFKYLTSDGVQELTIDEAPKKVKRVLAGPEFKALEIRFRRGGTTPESYILSCGKDHFLGRAKGTPGDVISFTDVDKDQVFERMYSNHPDKKFPDDFQITLKVHPNVKEHTVSFRFENVPLPTPDSKPK